MLTIRDDVVSDVLPREALLDAAFGSDRFRKASEAMRFGRLPAEGLALSACAGSTLIGTVRLWHIHAGSAGASLLLGPLAVAAAYRGRGVGQQLMWHALQRAKILGHRSILLVGDEAYYQQFGFSHAAVSQLMLEGAPDISRLLWVELVAGSLFMAQGLLTPTGFLERATAQAA